MHILKPQLLSFYSPAQKSSGCITCCIKFQLNIQIFSFCLLQFSLFREALYEAQSLPDQGQRLKVMHITGSVTLD